MLVFNVFLSLHFDVLIWTVDFKKYKTPKWLSLAKIWRQFYNFNINLCVVLLVIASMFIVWSKSSFRWFDCVIISFVSLFCTNTFGCRIVLFLMYCHTHTAIDRYTIFENHKADREKKDSFTPIAYKYFWTFLLVF